MDWPVARWRQMAAGTSGRWQRGVTTPARLPAGHFPGRVGALSAAGTDLMATEPGTSAVKVFSPPYDLCRHDLAVGYLHTRVSACARERMLLLAWRLTDRPGRRIRPEPRGHRREPR